jgi:hypothetical protein
LLLVSLGGAEARSTGMSHTSYAVYSSLASVVGIGNWI